MSKNILVVVSTNTYFSELFRFSEMLERNGEFKPVLLFAHYYPTIKRDIGKALSAKLICLDEHGCAIKPSEQPLETELEKTTTLRRRLRSFAPTRAVLNFINFLVNTFIYYRCQNYYNPISEIIFLKRRIKFAEKAVIENEVKLIVVGGDLVHYDSFCFIRAAHNLNCPSVIVPCTMSNALEMAESYLPVKKYHGSRPLNWLVGKMFPEWVYTHNGRKLIRLPAYKVLAMKALKLSPPCPWINNSGFADCILAESEAMVKYYTVEGISREQVALTGSVSNDLLASSLQNTKRLRRELYEKLSIKNQKPLIVSALPPDQLYMVGGRPECEFKTYKQLVEYWVESLGRTKNFNTIINLHPSVDREDYLCLEKYGVKIASEDITKLIPLCDLFVASVSSVIRFAIACGKPVINYDLYAFRYTDYLNLPGVLIMEKRHEFQDALKKLTSSGRTLIEMASAQKRSAGHWGRLDGMVHERMSVLFNEKIKKCESMSRDQKKIRKILFVVNTSTFFWGLADIARELKEKSEFTPFLFFSGDYPNIEKDLKKCQDGGIEYGIERSGTLIIPWARGFLKALFLTVRAYRRELKYIDNLINTINPTIVILAADNVWYNTSSFIKCAHRKKIPSVIIPQWMAGAREPAEFIYNNPNYGMTILNKFAAILFPKWAITYGGKKLLRLPAMQVLAKQLLGLDPKRPWILHSSRADVIALESEAMKIYCENEGLEKEKLKIVGSISNDTIFHIASNIKTERDKILRELNLEIQKPVILSPLPPDFLYVQGGRSECEFSDYKKLVEFWIKSLAESKRFNVIMSLHPSVNVDKLKYVEKWGVKISTRSIAELIPICDLFVASVSATIQWAIAAGKPVLNYDVYKYRYHDYDDAKGVITVESKKDFIKYLNKLTADKGYLAEITKLQQSVATKWGRLDGKSGERIMGLVRSLGERDD